MKPIRVKIESEDQMTALAADLAGLLPPHTVILLSGNLGAGKTVFARGFIRAACYEKADQTVSSPTFNMVSLYDGVSGPIYHYDLYRVKDPDEIFELGIEDVYTAQATLIEWPDRLPPQIRDSFKRRLDIEITIAPDGGPVRDIIITPRGVGSDIDTAFVFAAGKGTRMREYVRDVPKPLVSVGGKPTLAYFIAQAEAAGMTRLFFNTHYLPHRVNEFAALYQNRFEIHTLYEETLLETGGGLKQALPLVNRDVFFAMNGDALLEEGPGLTMLDRLALAFDPDRMDILLLLSKTTGPSVTKSVGDYTMDATGRLTRSLDLSGGYMFAGLRLLHARVFDGVSDGIFSFRDQMDAAQAKGRLYGLAHTGLYHHISTPEDMKAVTEYMTHRQSAPKILNAG